MKLVIDRPITTTTIREAMTALIMAARDIEGQQTKLKGGLRVGVARRMDQKGHSTSTKR